MNATNIIYYDKYLKQIILLLYCIICASLIPSHALADTIPPELLPAVHIAEEDGLAIYNASKNPKPVEEAIIKQAKEKIKDFCDFQYATFPVSLH